jgi:hypothetical protein
MRHFPFLHTQPICALASGVMNGTSEIPLIPSAGFSQCQTTLGLCTAVRAISVPTITRAAKLYLHVASRAVEQTVT